MDRIKNIAIVLLTILVVVVVFFLCVNFHKNNNPETKTIKTDTLYVHDTIEIKKDSIVYRDKKVTDTLYLPTPQDTTPIPIEQKHYVDTLADIWISGYEPTIDSIHYHVPQNTMYVEKTIEIEKPKSFWKDRFIFTVGVYGGYGLIYKQPDIFVGIGMGFRLY